jgi:hypothetical protein
VKIIVPYSAGGGTDVVTRVLAQRLSESMGQPFVVDNRPGADATIGPAIAAKTAPDGYTLLATSGVSFLITRSSMKDLSYDPMKDFAPVALFASVPMVLIGAPNLEPQDAKALVAMAKSGPRSLDYAGTDQMVFLATEQLAQGTGMKMQHIPVQGSRPRAQRSSGRSRRRDARQHQLRAAAHQGGQDQGVRGDREARAPARCRTCRRERIDPARLRADGLVRHVRPRQHATPRSSRRSRARSTRR